MPLRNPEISALLDRLTPHAAIYVRLKAGLAQYRSIEQRGGWGPVDEGPTLHAGDRSSRVTALRWRLGASADLRNPGPVTDQELFDTALAQATRHFQTRHQLDADGVVGKKTLAALNVSVTQRIDQIRINLERARWLLHDLPASYVLVDIAGFAVRYVQDGKELLRSRAVVGKPYRKTPIFRASISYLEFNPTWTMPPTILRQDILPEIRKNRAISPAGTCAY
ncbi:MAG: L,D-transpeptidase family protein [Gammaproteobacteria bacterium]|nr:L,D-transpeptidase family protein [Gammaproteobacteria bacterium]